MTESNTNKSISSKIKNSIKPFIPNYVYLFRDDIRIRKIYQKERKRFCENYGTSKSNNNRIVDSKLIFHAHALEKGLSHIHFRNGFGKSALNEIHNCLVEYKNNEFSKETLAYKNAMSCLKAYQSRHKELDLPIPLFFEELFVDFKEEIELSDPLIGGYSKLKRIDKENNRSVDFKTLFNNRVSIREFSEEPVDCGLLEEAIELSMKTPSVCNRQSSRVRIIKNKEIIKKALVAQGGFTGYDIPPVLMLVTTDTNSFLHYTERNQIYIDGGLFAMSILIALEYVGLAACALNSMFGIDKEKEVREILDVPENENFIMFISIGNFLEETPYPKSCRFTGKSITTIIE